MASARPRAVHIAGILRLIKQPGRPRVLQRLILVEFLPAAVHPAAPATGELLCHSTLK